MTLYNPIALPERLASFSLDLEEDHAGLSDQLQYEAAEILPEIVGWFDKNKIPLTIFVAGNYLERKGQTLDGLTTPEFHSHGYWHPRHDQMWRDDIRQRNIRDGLKAFESFFKRKSVGYSAACGVIKEEDLALLAEAGLKFDSSFFTGLHVSGFHVFRSAKPRWYQKLNFVEIPISAHPFFRLPVSMAYMKLMGPALFSFPQRIGLGLRPLVFNFHLHDLVKTSIVKGLSPFWKWIYRAGSGQRLMADWTMQLKDTGIQFVTMGQLYERLAAKVKGS